MLNFGNFKFAKQQREGWPGKRNNAVLKNDQSALATSKSKLHKLKKIVLKKIIAVWEGNQWE